MMKNLFKIATICFGVLLFNSCSDEVILLNGGDANCIRCFKVDIDGTTWQATEENAIINNSTDEILNTNTNDVLINGIATNAGTIRISYSVDTLGTGVYDTTTASIVYTVNDTDYVADADTSGSSALIEITGLNQDDFTISGTFSGVLVALDGTSVTLENGNFNEVAYVLTQTIIHNASGTFSVDIDGTTTDLGTISLVETITSESTNSTYTLTGASSSDANADFVTFVFDNSVQGDNAIVAVDATGIKASYFSSTIGNAINATTGNINITSNTTTLLSSSSFEFTIDNSGTNIAFTNGTFNVNF